MLATQNPIESEGVYPLPEAQRDRFLMKVVVDYPTGEEEREIVYRMGVQPPVAGPGALPGRPAAAAATRPATSSCTTRWSTTWSGWSCPPAPRRDHGMADVAGWVAYGASPRASLGMIAAARALALMRGRDYVLPQDVLDIAADVLRHRLVLSYDALADGVPAEHVVHRVLQSVPLPQVTPRQRAAGGPYGAQGGGYRGPRPPAATVPPPDARDARERCGPVTSAAAAPPTRSPPPGLVACGTPARRRPRRCCAGWS